MDDHERDGLRRLALWLALRRETDDVLARLTRYGPAASAQVANNLHALEELLDQEARAFSAVQVSAARSTPQRPVRANVHSMDQARDRHESP